LITLSITFKRDGGHEGNRTCGKPLFQIVSIKATMSVAITD
jgi:hypothetical protein